MADQVLKVLQQPPFQIYELITVAQGNLQVEAIDAGGGGGSGVPLVHAMFVDPSTSVAPADQTGAATAPFSTVLAAIAALPTPAGGAVLLAPAQYPAEVINIVGQDITLMGLCGPQNDTARIAAPVDLTSSSISSTRPVNLINLQIGNVDLTVVPETPQVLLASGCNINGAALFDSARLVDCLTTTLQGTGPIFMDGCQVIGNVTCAGEPTWNSTTVSGDVTCEDLIANDCTISGSVSNASVFDPLLFNHTAVGLISSSATVTMLNGSSCQLTCDCAGLTIRDSTIGGVVTSSSEVTSSDSTIGADLTCTRLARAADTSFQGITCGGAAFSHLRGCTYNTLAGAAGGNVDLDSYSLGSGPPTGFDSVTLVAPRADLVVNVPVLGANAIGSVAVSTVGSGLDGLAVGDSISTQEPTAGVAGGGFLASWFIDAADSITFKFHGVTSGGNQTFRVTRI